VSRYKHRGGRGAAELEPQNVDDASPRSTVAK
jgi:hypothetical protein